MSEAQQPYRTKVGNWEIGRNTSGSTPYCYASLEFQPGRKLIVNVMRSPGLVLSLFNERWSLRPSAEISILAAFDEEPARALPAQIFLPQMVIIPVLEWRPFAARLSSARRLALTVEGQRFQIDLADSGAAYAEARRCIDGSAASARPPTLSTAAESVDGWSLTADRQRGEFMGCTALPDGDQGMGLKIDRRFRHYIFAIDDRWNLTGRTIPAMTRIDGATLATSALVHTSNAVLVRVGDARTYLGLLQSGRHLTVRIGDVGKALDLASATPVVAALERCVRREVAAGGPSVSSAGYTLQQVQAFAIALLRDAGLDGFELEPDVESFERAHNLAWVYDENRGIGSLQVVKDAPADYLDLRTTRLLGLFRDGCIGTYDARVVDTAEGPGWRARRLFTNCDRDASPGRAGLARWIVLRFDSGIGMTVGNLYAASAGLSSAPTNEFDEAIWRSNLLRQPPTE